MLQLLHRREKEDSWKVLPEQHLLVLSDLHFMYDSDWDVLENTMPAADVVLLLGDIGRSCAARIRQIVPENLPILFVLGNHDLPHEYDDISWMRNVDGTSIFVKGIRYGGLAGSIKYKEAPYVMRTEKEASRIMATLPECDILCTHTCSRSYAKATNPAHHGFACIDRYLHTNAPAFHLFGHLHHSERKKIGDTDCICVYRAMLLNTKTGEATSLF